MRKSNGYKVKVMFILLFLILASALFFIDMPPSVNGQIPVQLPEHNDLAINIEPMMPLTPSATAALSPDKIDFNVTYALSKWLINTFSSPVIVEIPKGALSGLLPLDQISGVLIHDNLGNMPHPNMIIENGTVTNPEFNATVPPGFIYSVEMDFASKSGTSFDYARASYIYSPSFTLSQFSSISIKLPSSFTILDFQSEGIVNQGNGFTTIIWMVPEGGSINPQIRFIPFSNEPTLRSFDWEADLSSLQPNDFVYATVTEVVSTRASFGQWQISPIFPLIIHFPQNASSVVVEKVTDALGDCPKQNTPTDIVGNSSVGHYFVSRNASYIVVYPHAYNFEGTYEFQAKVTFRFNSNSANGSPLKFPFSASTSFKPNINATSEWKIDFTDNSIITFILPSNTEITGSNNGQASSGFSHDGRPQASFVINPDTLSGQTLTVYFDVVPERALFWYSIAVILGLFFLLIVCLKTHWLENSFLKELGSASVILGAIGFQVWYFLSTVSFWSFAYILFTIQVIIVLLISAKTLNLFRKSSGRRGHGHTNTTTKGHSRHKKA